MGLAFLYLALGTYDIYKEERRTRSIPMFLNMALSARSSIRTISRLQQAVRCFSNSSRRLSASGSTTNDNPVPVNTTLRPSTATNATETNAIPTSPTHGQDRALVEDPVEGEQMRVQQAPNRLQTWSRSQRPRSDAMTGPRFEQMIVETQACRLIRYNENTS